MAISIAIITAPGSPLINYLDAAIISLRKASFQEIVHIFAEPFSFISKTNLFVV